MFGAWEEIPTDGTCFRRFVRIQDHLLRRMVRRPATRPSTVLDHVRVLDFHARLRRSAPSYVTFIGVTGSCGKSTTVALANGILSSTGRCFGVTGPSRALATKTNSGVKASRTFCIQELHANQPGVIAESVRILKPQFGVVTLIGGDHYRNYRNVEATAQEKGLLVESLPESGVAILNIDSPLVADMAKRTRARLLTFGRSPEAVLRAVDVSSVWPDRLSMQVTYGGETFASRPSSSANTGSPRCWPRSASASPAVSISKPAPRS